MRISARLEFKAADCWIGVYWTRQAEILHIWICLLPMLPLHLHISQNRTGANS